MITPDIIKRRLQLFWGYGSFESPVWFVGMEEGVGPIADFKELEIRFRAADGKSTIDMRQDMFGFDGHMRWFRGKFPIQPTWKYPIALYLYLKNHRAPSSQEIREYQGLILGDSTKKESSAIELMPLPSQKAHEVTWLYKKYNMPDLNSRKEYLAAHKPRRVQELKHLIKTYTPKLIIFYSLTYLPEWIEVIGKTPKEITPGMHFVKSGQTIFCVLPQGASFGMSYKRLYEFAEIIQSKVTL